MNIEKNFEKPEARLVKALLENELKIATAESCTGGMIASRITAVPGASACFDCGVVTYSNQQKHRLLGVEEETLAKMGAVSEETALQMCKGVTALAGADIGISVTGIAGPGGGTADKPVGTVWIGVCTENVHRAFRFLFSGDRNQVRLQTTIAALEIARRAARCEDVDIRS